MLEETIKISLTAAIELVDVATGSRYRNKAARLQLPRGLKWMWKEDGYLILIGTCTENKIPVQLEGHDILTVRYDLCPMQEKIIRIPVYPSPGRRRTSGCFYLEGMAMPGTMIWAELPVWAAAVRLRNPYHVAEQERRISLFSRQKLSWLGQSFLITEGEQQEMFTILGEAEGEANVFLLENPLTGNYSMKATVSPVIRTWASETGRYLLAYPRETIEIGQIHEER